MNKPSSHDAPILRVENLDVSASGPSGAVKIVDGVNFTVAAGRSLALVGESGSGKSLTCLSLVRVMPPTARISKGGIFFAGDNLATRSEREMNAIRGEGIGMILQDPMTSLNPLMTVGEQIGEMFRHHQGMRSASEIRAAVIRVMKDVGIPAPEGRINAYPHQFSGGMRQRIAIAIAVACRPRLLIADEPTTALDVTIRLQILKLLKDIQQQTGMAVVFVTHDLNLVKYFCDDVAVMYAGKIVEQGPVSEVFAAPEHPYTQALLNAIPRVTTTAARLTVIDGQPPLFTALPAGCRFAPRCVKADEHCFGAYPPSGARTEAGTVACWKARETQKEAVL
ncbi:MAG: ABC transporter ATP-binding protein [Rhizobiaceae bacterium]